MFIDKRQLAVGACGFCAFTNLYPVQALMPELMSHFNATAAEVGLSLAAGTLAVALTAPFAGALSDNLGRKPMILFSLATVGLVTMLTILSGSIEALIGWRFLVGFFIPGIFTTTVAYIGEEWSQKEAVETSAIYIAGTVLGGFAGRFIAGLATDFGGWQAAFVTLGVMDLLLVPLVWRWLPASQNFNPTGGVMVSLRAMAGHMRNPLLLQTFVLSFGILFTLVAVFTYVSLRLALPPFSLGTGLIGGVFAVYLLSVVITPLVGRQISRFGRAPIALAGMLISLAGLMITLGSSLFLVVLGLALFSIGIFIMQSIATGFVPQAAGFSPSAAVGLYVMIYYIGGSLGAVVPGPVWQEFGWLGCVVLVAVALLIMTVTSYRLWTRDPHTQRMMAERRGS